jgi:tetratricopeptide (TPR) repeat protein
MKRVGLICTLIVLQALGSYAAGDSIKRSMELYKKNHYEDAAILLQNNLSSADLQQPGKTYLSLGLIYFASAKLYRELYDASTAVQTDYLTKLLAADSKSESRFVSLYLGRTLLESGNYIEAAAFVKKFIADNRIESQFKDYAKVSLGNIYFLQGKSDEARRVWSGLSDSQPLLSTALAAAFSRAGLMDNKPSMMCQKALQKLKQNAKSASIDIINNIIAVYAREGRINEGIDLLKQADLKIFSQEETLVKNKVIRFYDPALLRNLSLFYEKASLNYLRKAASAADDTFKDLARYYLSAEYSHFGNADESMKIIDSFIAKARLPLQYKNKTRVLQAVNNYLLGREAIAKEQFDKLIQANADPYVVADILLACTRHQIEFPQAIITATAMAQKGEDRRFAGVNFALGRYYMGKKDYVRATTYMEAGRDKSNKNRIESNDPLMLVSLAKVYYLTKKFSEALEIYFEMSKQFPAIRQIQVALQGVYSMEQKSAGDVKIF